MSKNTWVAGVIFVVCIAVLAGSGLSNTALLELVKNSDVYSDQSVTESIESPWQKNGNLYTTTVTYSTPAGIEVNTFSLTLEDDGSISNFAMTIETKNEVSIAYQEKFISGLTEAIVGKSLQEVASIDTIAGASLTTDAFTTVVTQL